MLFKRDILFFKELFLKLLLSAHLLKFAEDLGFPALNLHLAHYPSAHHCSLSFAFTKAHS